MLGIKGLLGPSVPVLQPGWLNWADTGGLPACTAWSQGRVEEPLCGSVCSPALYPALQDLLEWAGGVGRALLACATRCPSHSICGVLSDQAWMESTAGGLRGTLLTHLWQTRGPGSSCSGLGLCSAHFPLFLLDKNGPRAVATRCPSFSAGWSAAFKNTHHRISELEGTHKNHGALLLGGWPMWGWNPQACQHHLCGCTKCWVALTPEAGDLWQ